MRGTKTKLDTFYNCVLRKQKRETKSKKKEKKKKMCQVVFFELNC